MIQRLISIVLLPFLVVGNSFAHSHEGSTHSSQDQSRAHFHLTGAYHDHHGHDSHSHFHHGHQHDHQDHENDRESATSQAPIDHDSDAIYLVALDYALPSLQGSSLEASNHLIDIRLTCDTSDTRFLSYFPTYRSATSSGPPIYLLHAALRL